MNGVDVAGKGVALVKDLLHGFPAGDITLEVLSTHNM